MTPFTDDDLKLLKDCADYKGPLLDQFHKLPALLSRLEAAEEVASYAKDYAPKGIKLLDAAIEKWRKACGK